MREAAFIKRHKTRWQKFERVLENTTHEASPDQLSDFFIYLTDDLSYARTFYPGSKTTAYLNQLTVRLHQRIYKNKKEERSRFRTFWQYELPKIVFQSRRPLLYAACIFVLSVLLGILSATRDEGFARLILGDQYVNMTIANIEKNDPMAVYKSMDQINMFSYITLNNVMVSFRVFVFGIFFSVGSALVLFYNGVMVGVFQYFFHQYGLLFTSFLSIWIHGTLEISAIMLAGGAGMVMGNSLLFPGTYPRLTSLKIGAKKGLKIVVGLVPIFIFAGFLESFVTRKTALPVWVKLGIIILSALFIVGYFVIYPLKMGNPQTKNTANN